MSLAKLDSSRSNPRKPKRGGLHKDSTSNSTKPLLKICKKWTGNESERSRYAEGGVVVRHREMEARKIEYLCRGCNPMTAIPAATTSTTAVPQTTLLLLRLLRNRHRTASRPPPRPGPHPSLTRARLAPNRLVLYTDYQGASSLHM
jgi:hypothetical protein